MCPCADGRSSGSDCTAGQPPERVELGPAAVVGMPAVLHGDPEPRGRAAVPAVWVEGGDVRAYGYGETQRVECFWRLLLGPEQGIRPDAQGQIQVRGPGGKGVHVVRIGLEEDDGALERECSASLSRLARHVIEYPQDEKATSIPARHCVVLARQGAAPEVAEGTAAARVEEQVNRAGRVRCIGARLLEGEESAAARPGHIIWALKTGRRGWTVVTSADKV